MAQALDGYSRSGLVLTRPPSRTGRRHLVALFVLAVLAGASCSEKSAVAPPSAPESTAPVIRFVDVTEEAGLGFVHVNGASERRYLPETMGSGVAFFDADGDERPDLFFLSGGAIDPEAEPPSRGSPPALYRNLSDGTFADVTAQAGLAEPFFGLGAAVGDLDNDGDNDLFASGLMGDRLFLNRGDGTFEEAAERFGLTDRGFGSSAAFLDYDRDGWLDLFVGRYVTWSPATDVVCRPDGERPSYCTPEVYPGESNRLYRNVSGRFFADVTTKARLFHPEGKTLGVVPFDYDRDGWPDLAVANDTVRNFLFLNQRNGTFREAAVELGTAFSVSGAVRGAMGIDTGDLDGRGDLDLVIGNFAQEMSSVYMASREGLFSDSAAELGIGLPTLMSLAFGTLVLDVDLDGWLDVVFANGHIEPDIALFQPVQSYPQPVQLFHNMGGPAFEQLTTSAGLGQLGPWVGRGLAAADYDGDGDLDLVLTQNGGSARLLRNDSAPRSWLRLRLVGRQSNRSAYGATVVASSGSRHLLRRLTSGRSYLSASEPILTFGLGDATSLERLEIAWPSGILQVIEKPELGRLHVVTEPDE